MADEDSKNQSIIIVKKVSGHGGHHGGAWKVAYADFVTALMAFFLVMWLVSQSDQVKQSVQSYFRDPVGFMKGKGQGVLKGGGVPKKNIQPGKADINDILEKERNALLDVGQRIRQAIEDMPELNSLMDFVDIEMIPEGLRIQLIDSDKDKNANFFDIGCARLRPKTTLLLKAISAELGRLPNFIVVEGHTDSKPFTGREDYSNWELSADRANSARKLMESSGLWAGQLVEVRGYADRMPRIHDSPNDARNRRVAIIVLNDEASKRYKDI
jgi:chemotaxis protein MotB